MAAVLELEMTPGSGAVDMFSNVELILKGERRHSERELHRILSIARPVHDLGSNLAAQIVLDGLFWCWKGTAFGICVKSHAVRFFYAPIWGDVDGDSQTAGEERVPVGVGLIHGTALVLVALSWSLCEGGWRHVGRCWCCACAVSVAGGVA
jgi:hypothetical protein